MPSPAVNRVRSEPDRGQHRLRLACLRCQRRKIRCDGELPNCKNCRNSGAQCQDGISARTKDLPRAHISKLRRRISWLESIIRERCPDVDLSPPAVEDDVDNSMQDLDNSFATSVTEVDAQLEEDGITRSIPFQPVQASVGQVLGGPNRSAHEIGMVSLGANQDPRYIGPSSGYFLARVMLSKRKDTATVPSTQQNDGDIMGELVEALQGPLPLPPRTTAEKICDAYFDMIQPQYPILHQPTFMAMLDSVYAAASDSPVVYFQVYMVLAIGASTLSMRTRARLPSESYCLSALRSFHLLNIENSLQGLQCLLLLQVFAINSPSVRFNVWYLNYQCLAAVLDLGIQRDITVESGISLLEQEMRTRIFWVVIMLDRIIATMMGRPIGLRDEACDLRLPQGFEDCTLADPGQTTSTRSTTPMQYSVHLFRAAKINSEIKYVANSIVQEAPRYAYPPVTNIHQWQENVLQQLDNWYEQIPSSGESHGTSNYMDLICRLRYHGLCMLLLRPSPAIPKPTKEALVRCFKCAKDSLRILDDLYRQNLLLHSWFTFHGVVLGTLTMLYCVKAEPSVAKSASTDSVMADMSTALSILSATGEHWSGAKKCRDILDDLGKSTLQFLQGRNPSRRHGDSVPSASTRSSQRVHQMGGDNEPTVGEPHPMPLLSNNLETDSSHLYGDLFSGQFEISFPESESINMDIMIQDLFQDFIPTANLFE